MLGHAQQSGVRNSVLHYKMETTLPFLMVLQVFANDPCVETGGVDSGSLKLTLLAV